MCHDKIAAYEIAFMQTGYSGNVQPGNMDEDKKGQPEQKQNSDTGSTDNSSSPDCINADVVGLPSLSDDERIVKIEKALSGLTIEDAQYLLRKVNKSLTSKSLVSA